MIRSLFNRFVKLFARLASSIFYREVEVVGAGRIPADAPVVYVANHFNTLVDPLLILGFLPRETRFLATSVLWKNPALRPFLAIGGVIPVYRRHDPDFSPEKNEETFARCHEVLASGRSIALFPEGRSHDESALQPMKTGAARIVLGAERRQRLGIRIVPVGLTFDAKTRFRSRVLIKVGEPIDPAAGGKVPGPEDRDAVRALTERIGEGLEVVTLNYPSWEEARLIDRAAALYARTGADAPRRPRLSEDFALRKVFAEGYASLKAEHPERVARVAQSVESYDRMLTIVSLRHEQLIARYPPAVVAVYACRTLLLLLVRLPLAVVGIVLNAAPYFVAKFAGRFDLERARASYAIFTGFVVFPLTWIVEAFFAGATWGAAAGWVVAALGPLSGVSAVRFLERRRGFAEEARAYLMLRTREQMTRELERRREEVAREVAELAEGYR